MNWRKKNCARGFPEKLRRHGGRERMSLKKPGRSDEDRRVGEFQVDFPARIEFFSLGRSELSQVVDPDESAEPVDARNGRPLSAPWDLAV